MQLINLKLENKVYKKGKDYGLISYGTILNYCFRLDDILVNKGFKNSIVSCHTLKPLDEKI